MCQWLSASVGADSVQLAYELIHRHGQRKVLYSALGSHHVVKESNMGRVENTVFISYRRTNWSYAVAVAQDLSANGYDVFMDYKSIKTGDFEQIIFNSIESRAHFIVMLTPSALERCQSPSDWMRMEMEHALKHRRNIIPIIFEGFDFNNLRKQLPPHLAEPMSKYNALRVPSDYFEEAMARLRKDRLSQPLDTILHPKSKPARRYESQQAKQVKKSKNVDEKTLSAQEYFERGYQHYNAGRFQEAIADYTQAIKRKPDYAVAYNNRGVLYRKLGDVEAALRDYNAALQHDPQNANAYNNRGLLYENKLGDKDAALRDYNAALQHDPQYAMAYNNRGALYHRQGDYDAAIRDFEAALRIDPNHNVAKKNLEIAKRARGS